MPTYFFDVSYCGYFFEYSILLLKLRICITYTCVRIISVHTVLLLAIMMVFLSYSHLLIFENVRYRSQKLLRSQNTVSFLSNFLNQTRSCNAFHTARHYLFFSLSHKLLFRAFTYSYSTDLRGRNARVPARCKCIRARRSRMNA